MFSEFDGCAMRLVAGTRPATTLDEIPANQLPSASQRLRVKAAEHA
jgi:hypothetical protein